MSPPIFEQIGPIGFGYPNKIVDDGVIFHVIRELFLPQRGKQFCRRLNIPFENDAAARDFVRAVRVRGGDERQFFILRRFFRRLIPALRVHKP